MSFPEDGNYMHSEADMLYRCQQTFLHGVGVVCYASWACIAIKLYRLPCPAIIIAGRGRLRSTWVWPSSVAHVQLHWL